MSVSAKEEDWRDISFAPGYQVNQFGEVKSCSRTIVRKDGKPYPVKEKILKQRSYRYATVDLKLGHQCLVHRLVASCFLGLDYTDSLQWVNHIDNNKLNNNVDNLEVCTPSYNVKDGFLRGRIIHNKISEETRDAIRQMAINGTPKSKISTVFKVSRHTVWRICNE